MAATTLNPILLAATAPTLAPEAQLTQLARDGSLEAFEELVRQYEARIFGFLQRHMGNAHDAQDITQETFVRAWRAMHRFDPSRDFASWIFVIARRAAANHFRARRPHDELSEDLASEQTDSLASDESAALWSAARRLKPNHYEALWLRYAEGFSVKETARVMGLTTIHVKVILHRARKELARHLKPENL